MSRSRSRARRTTRTRVQSRQQSAPFITFLLVASLGILMVGCGSKRAPEAEEYSFTADDVAKFEELVQEENERIAQSQSGAQRLSLLQGSGAVVRLSSEEQRVYDAIRASGVQSEDGAYKVTNDFLNVRSTPSSRSSAVGRLSLGDTVQLLEFVNAEWAKIQLDDGTEGYVSHQYLGRLTTDTDLEAERAPFANRYFVDFSFLNVRSEPTASSQKLGQLPGQSFIDPISIDGDWAKVPFNDGEGYVSAQYLTKFEPNFVVRQEKFRLPIFLYNVEEDGMTDTLVRHIATMKEQGIAVLTLRDFYELLVFQEERDVRLEPRSIVLGITGLHRDNYQEVMDVLRASDQVATFFVETRHIGPESLTENRILTLIANGHDVQSGGYSGEDLRSMTNAQVELELQQGRLLLEEITSETVLGILYPQGGVNERVVDKALEIGYLFGIGAAPNKTFMRDELLRMPSLTIAESMSADEVLKVVIGE